MIYFGDESTIYHTLESLMGTIVREPMRAEVQRSVTSTFDNGRYYTQAIAKGPRDCLV